jgi:Flp pilus assembly protein TadG
MPIFHVTDRLKQSAARFAGAERGNVAMMFAIALVPMLGFIGAAIDYSRAVSARSAMQAAADATALMISKEATSLTA